jgi:hypothetical protein
MDATACLICLEKFTEDEAFIPELECECAFFVHWHCWEQWCGACLYCRVYDEEQVEEPVVENINEEIIQNGYDLFSNLLFLILAIFIAQILELKVFDMSSNVNLLLLQLRFNFFQIL